MRHVSCGMVEIDTSVLNLYSQTMKRTLVFVIFAYLICCSSILYAFTATNFQNPYGVAADSKNNFIYISNINGDPSATDDNGYISRLKGDGTVDQMRFIDGASKDVTLNAPKGMAIYNANLYVADINKLRVFDLATGKPLYDINFGDLPVQHFYGIAVGPDEALYLTDGPANVIYRLDVPKYHEVTTLISGDWLGGPHGICWYPGRQMFVVAASNLGQVIAFDRSGKRQIVPNVYLKAAEAVAADESGNVYVSSTAFSAVFKLMPNFLLNSFGLGFSQPMGVAFNRSGSEIVVTSFDMNLLQSIPLQFK